MKTITNYTRSMKKLALFVVVMFGLSITPSQAQSTTKKSLAVINIDSKGIPYNMALMTSLTTLEVERLNLFEVIDKYDVANHMKKNKINLTTAYGKTDLISIGKLLKVNKVLSGSVEKFGNKIIVVLRLIDVQKEIIEKADVMEYVDQVEDIQEMIRISLHNILGLENDKNKVDMLSNFNPPLTNNKSKLNLNGPRFGMTSTFGLAAKRLQAPKDQGGYNMFPISSSFGYQHEIQYISSGDFQALIEFVGMLNALESGNVIPSFSMLNGFRFNKIGLELGIGPVLRFSKMASGYYDTDEVWHLQDENTPANVDIIQQIDNRGVLKGNTGLIVAAGITLKSGYVNFPITAYVIPRKGATAAGLVFGFTIANKKTKIKDE